jgi:protein phosphatase
MIQAAITENPPPEACRILVQAAREAGGHDNISVGVFTVSNLAAQPAASERGTREVKVDDLGGSRT